MERRDFVKTMAATGMISALPNNSQAEDPTVVIKTPKLAVFTKSFQKWDIPTVCKKFKELGLDGLDLTVRPKGHILPENIKKELPMAAKTAKENGVEITQITSGIVEANAQAEELFQVASDLGITKIKLGYFKGGDVAKMKNTIDDTRRTIQKIAIMAGKYKVMPCIHIHSSNYVPSHGTMLYQLIQDAPTDRIGAYVDAMHMVIEGGKGGWKQGLGLVAPWIQLCAIKNFEWVKNGKHKSGQQLWKTQNVPVADGVSPVHDFVKTLKGLGYKGPYSLHSEYQGKHSFKDLDTDACYEQTRKDLEFFKPLVERV